MVDVVLLVLFVLGGILGAVLLVGFKTGRALGCELVRALAPLSLPLVVLLLVVAARALPLALAIVVFVAAIYLAYRLVVKPENDSLPLLAPKSLARRLETGSKVALQRAPGGMEKLSEHAGGVAEASVFLGVAILASVLAVVAFSPSFWISGRGQIPTALAEGALVLAGGVLLVRLAAFSWTPLRALLALAVFVLAGRAVVRAGLLPGENLLSIMSPLSLGLAVAGSFLLCAAVGAAVPKPENAGTPEPRRFVRLRNRIGQWRFVRQLNRLRRSRFVRLLNRPHWGGDTRNRIAGYGLYASLVSATALLASVLSGIYVMSRVSPGDASLARAAVSLSEIPDGDSVRPGVLSDEEIARVFMPVFVYTEDQRWLPVPVGSYLEGASLITGGRFPQHAPSESPALPSSCRRNISPPCFGLTIDCPLGSEPCAQMSKFTGGDELHRERTVYVRIVRRGRQFRRSPAAEEEAQTVFEYAGPFGKELRILVQYWLFYRYDEWTAPTILGRLVQRHEGDWEAITIGFSASEPLFIAYSAHCSGRWERWQDIHVAADVEPATHPLVAVAEGSQANYDNSQERRPPDWASCLDIDGTAFSALTYIWGIEDVTGDDYRLLPTDIRLVDGDTPPMTFPGTWGANARTVIHNFRTFRLGPEGAGPRTPSLQALWIDPLTTIFCSWRPRVCGKGSRPAEERPLVAPIEEP